MLVNQLISLKTGQRLGPSFLFFQYELQDNEMADKEKFLFTAIFRGPYEEGMVELEYHQFATLYELMNLGIKLQWPTTYRDTYDASPDESIQTVKFSYHYI